MASSNAAISGALLKPALSPGRKAVLSLNKSCFSSNREDWATPWELFHKVAKQHGPFDLDVCATRENAKCPEYFSPDQNSLSLANPWRGRCWMNPPYGRQIGLWLEKALKSVQEGTAQKVVCLIPARTDTAWWHNYVLPFGRIEFLRGRVKFEGAQQGAPFPSAIVVFEADQSNRCKGLQ